MANITILGGGPSLPAHLPGPEILREDLPEIITRLSVPTLPGALPNRESDLLVFGYFYDPLTKGIGEESYTEANRLFRKMAAERANGRSAAFFDGERATAVLVATHLPTREAQESAAKRISSDPALRGMPALILTSPEFPLLCPMLSGHMTAAQHSHGGELGLATINAPEVHFAGGWLALCLATSVNSVLKQLLKRNDFHHSKIRLHADCCQIPRFGVTVRSLLDETMAQFGIGAQIELRELPTDIYYAFGNFTQDLPLVTALRSVRVTERGVKVNFHHEKRSKSVEFTLE